MILQYGWEVSRAQEAEKWTLKCIVYVGCVTLTSPLATFFTLFDYLAPVGKALTHRARALVATCQASWVPRQIQQKTLLKFADSWKVTGVASCPFLWLMTCWMIFLRLPFSPSFLVDSRSRGRFLGLGDRSSGKGKQPKGEKRQAFGGILGCLSQVLESLLRQDLNLVSGYKSCCQGLWGEEGPLGHCAWLLVNSEALIGYAERVFAFLKSYLGLKCYTRSASIRSPGS